MKQRMAPKRDRTGSVNAAPMSGLLQGSNSRKQRKNNDKDPYPAGDVGGLLGTRVASPGVAQTTAVPAAITTPDKVETRIGTLEYKDGAPSAPTVDKVYDSLDYIRGVNAFMNSFSGASAYAIRQGFHSIGADDNSIVLFSDLMAMRGENP